MPNSLEYCEEPKESVKTWLLQCLVLKLVKGNYHLMFDEFMNRSIRVKVKEENKERTEKNELATRREWELGQ